MQKLIIALTVSVVLASGCAVVGKQIDPRTGVDGYDPALVTRPRPTAPNVFIDRNDFLVVDQEPIRVFRSKPKGDKETVEVVWALPARSNYTFTGDGIRFTNPAARTQVQEQRQAVRVLVPSGARPRDDLQVRGHGDGGAASPAGA
jgi:hypothetical protein